MSEIRRDRLTGETVIISPSRSSRPHSDSSEAEACPFCPGNEEQTPPSVLELSLDGQSWFVRVFENRFPIVSGLDVPAPPDDTGRTASGVHEVIVETPSHDQEVWQRSPAEVALMLRAYRDRLRIQLAAPPIQYVAVFQNRRQAAGASLEHPHSQVIGLTYVPDAVARQVQLWQDHHARTGTCLLCDELNREQEDGRRILLREDDFLLYAPFGGVRPGELILAPLRHQASFMQADDEALHGMVKPLLRALGRQQATFEAPAYNLVLQTWPRVSQEDVALHWYLRIIPRRAVLGGFEIATGDFAGVLSPEDAVHMLRESA